MSPHEERRKPQGGPRASRPRAAVHLRTILSWITGLVVGVALVVSAALVLLTTFLNHTSESLAAAVESVRLAEEIEIDLLLHSRTADPLVRQNIAGDLRDKLEDAELFVTTADEAVVLRSAVMGVARYLEPAPPGEPPAAREGLRDAAYAAAQELVDINVRQAQGAQQNARRYDMQANVLGTTAAGLLLVVAGLLLWWLRTRAFRPLWDIARAMENFGRGDHHARAEEVGPAELREVALRFNQMASALAAQRQAQITFLGGVAHDLRNPLCALRMAVSAHDRGQPIADPRTRQTLETVARQTTYLERMVGDFLDISRIEAGELDLQPEVRDLRELAREAAEPFRASSPRHAVTLALHDAPVVVECDALRIQQAIVNLLSNAIKYSPSGGEVEVAVGLADEGAVVSVRDHGIGMRAEDVRRIFEPFTRVGLSRDAVPGAGLGLYIVQKIVQASHGRVEVESAPGRGSTFRIVLPAHAPTQAE